MVREFGWKYRVGSGCEVWGQPLLIRGTLFFSVAMGVRASTHLLASSSCLPVAKMKYDAESLIYPVAL